MGILLMCKNVPVYDANFHIVIDYDRVPGKLGKLPGDTSFKIWAQSRYSSPSNVLARNMQGGIFGQGNRRVVDRTTRSLSLSDCYWLKEESDSTMFEDVSPYFVDFWKGSGSYEGQAIPTLYTDGYLTKKWEDKNWLVKNLYHSEHGRSAVATAQLEVDCCRLCENLGIFVNEIVLRESGYVAVKNFTNENVMLEQADTSGRLDASDFELSDIIRVFGADGARMVAIDAVVGNTDRHTGNFGFLRDANSGEYLCMAPLYDFDWALSPLEIGNSLITNAAEAIKKTDFVSEVINMMENIINLDTRNEFKERVKLFLAELVSVDKTRNGPQIMSCFGGI